MEILGILGSVLLGISVIGSLIKGGEIGGCFGIFLIICLIIIISLVGLTALLFSGIGGQVL
jgi:hypothetical protein